MLRALGRQVVAGIRSGSVKNRAVNLTQARMHHEKESDDEFDKRYLAYFERPDIDGWEIRKAMNDLIGLDLVPEPEIIIASLKACRRINDFALTVRWLEALKWKADCADEKIYPYILQEIRPTLDELGINTPEELGYDKPELAHNNYAE